MSDYPLPSHACSVWLDGDTLWAAFPPRAGSDKGHKVHLTADEYGIKSLLTILRARQCDGRHTVGTVAAPVQYDLETIAKTMKLTTVVKTTVKAPSKAAVAYEVKRQREAELASILHDLDLDGVEL
jgi:hypothetical protein